MSKKYTYKGQEIEVFQVTVDSIYDGALMKSMAYHILGNGKVLFEVGHLNNWKARITVPLVCEEDRKDMHFLLEALDECGIFYVTDFHLPIDTKPARKYIYRAWIPDSIGKTSDILETLVCDKALENLIAKSDLTGMNIQFIADESAGNAVKDICKDVEWKVVPMETKKIAMVECVIEEDDEDLVSEVYGSFLKHPDAITPRLHNPKYGYASVTAGFLNAQVMDECLLDILDMFPGRKLSMR